MRKARTPYTYFYWLFYMRSRACSVSGRGTGHKSNQPTDVNQYENDRLFNHDIDTFVGLIPGMMLFTTILTNAEIAISLTGTLCIGLGRHAPNLGLCRISTALWITSIVRLIISEYHTIQFMTFLIINGFIPS